MYACRWLPNVADTYARYNPGILYGDDLLYAVVGLIDI